MREFLFKGKRTDNGQWVDGDLLRIKNVYRKINTYMHKITENGLFEKHEVKPETVCQFTGLYDSALWEELSEIEQKKFLSEWNFEKNRQNTKEDWKGRKIFEGDIIKHDMSITIGAVKWYQGNYTGWYMDDIYMGEQQFANEMWNESKVIGNIFDDPELLKGDGAE